MHVYTKPSSQRSPLTGGLCWLREGDFGHGPTTVEYCDSSNTRFPCAAGRRYFGRGPMQLSWNYNYGQAGRALGLDLLHNPDWVAQDPVRLPAHTSLCVFTRRPTRCWRFARRCGFGTRPRHPSPRAMTSCLGDTHALSRTFMHVGSMAWVGRRSSSTAVSSATKRCSSRSKTASTTFVAIVPSLA